MEKDALLSVDQYIERYSPEEQQVLQRLRQVIKKAVPTEAKEVMSYAMPAFRLNRVFIYYAAFTHHYSLFIPPSKVFIMYQKELAGYKIHKATIQFPKSEPIPYELIGKLATAAAEVDQERATNKIHPYGKEKS